MHNFSLAARALSAHVMRGGYTHLSTEALGRLVSVLNLSLNCANPPLGVNEFEVPRAAEHLDRDVFLNVSLPQSELPFSQSKISVVCARLYL